EAALGRRRPATRRPSPKAGRRPKMEHREYQTSGPGGLPPSWDVPRANQLQAGGYDLLIVPQIFFRHPCCRKALFEPFTNFASVEFADTLNCMDRFSFSFYDKSG